MRTPHCRLWLAGLLFCGVIASCSGGGRGSSGFDVNAENAAIEEALTSRQCVDFQGLAICAANAAETPTPGSPSPTPAASSVDTALGNLLAIDCVQSTPGSCTYTLTFTPHGFPPATTFRVLARAVPPEGPWVLGTDPVPS